MGDESRRKIDSSLEFDFGLDLKMQVRPTESTSRKRAINSVSPHYYHLSSSSSSNSFSTITNQALGRPTTVYGSYFGGSGGGSGGYAVFPRSGSYNSSSYKGGVVMSEKALFTETQRQELERQKMIYKFIMASIPVPPQLLSFQYSKTSGSDPEPWRCKRTDGKKWRCSRDVVPDQKYCERHAHKTKPRSRKLVETQSHKNYSQSSLLLSPNYTKSQKPFDFTASFADQTREWSRRDVTTTGDTAISVSTCNQPWHQQLMQPSSNNIVNNENNLSLFQYEDKQGFTNSFIDEPKIAYLQGSLDLNAEKTETTRHFFDAWSTGEKDGSSLTLSMSRGIGIGVGEDMNSVKENDGFLGSGGSWIDSQPGGPLGEVLGLGTAAVGGGGKGASPRHHGYSNSTTSSCCSKSSCDDGSHAHNFIG